MEFLCFAKLVTYIKVLINYPQPLICKGRKDLALTKGILNLVCSEANWSAENMIGILEGLSMLVVRGDMRSEKGEKN